MKRMRDQMIWILNLKPPNLETYLISTTIVPLSYHHLQHLEKTKGLHVPLEYLYSTTIFHFDPYDILSKNQANL